MMTVELATEALAQPLTLLLVLALRSFYGPPLLFAIVFINYCIEMVS